MRPVIRLWPILVLVYILTLTTPTYGVVSSELQTDSLRKVLIGKKGSDKISIQLDLALHIFENEKSEALSLAESALETAQKINNKFLEMRSYYTLGKIYLAFNNIELSQSYFDTALAISNAIDDNWYKGEILFRKGINQHNKGDNLKALESFKDALQASRLSNNYKTMGSSYSMMGSTFRVNGLYDRAIEYIIKSKLNYEKADFREGSAWATYLLGRIYADLRLPQKAREYFQEALKTYKVLASIDGNENGVAICHEQIGLLDLESGNSEEARKHIEYVLEIHSESKSKLGISNAYKHLGKIEYSIGNYIQAENYLNDALIIKKENSDLLSLPSIYEYIGLCQIGRGRIEEGLNIIQQGLKLALSNNQKKIQLDIYSKLTEAYLNLKDFEKAISYQKKQIEIQNAILQGSASIKMEQLQTIYEIDEKNSQIADLEKQNEINSLRIKQHRIYRISMVIGILLISFILGAIYLFYNRIRIKNRELKEANATKDKLFTVIAHDLRGPISSLFGISGFQIKAIENKDYSKIEKFALLIHQSLSDSVNLLNNLLDWSQSQLQRIELNLMQLNLLDSLNETKELMAVQLEKKNIHLEINVDRDYQIFADEAMLQTILRNLISNSIKFSHKNNKVEVNSIIKDKFIEVSIRDHGIGMKPEVSNNLFSLESNKSSLGTSGERGTGLGLILCKEFIEKQGGRIWVESEENKGSSFYIALPMK